MNATKFIASLGWEIAGFQSGKVTKVKLSDGKTVIPFCPQLQADIEAVLSNASAKSGPVPIQSVDQPAA